ncbi:hypothetical protein BEP19_16605 [Ammoniphilus oxalaticus]|uniref:Uncharacterized protein n=1 Tax=Ammoniphilus oxalaticus TaxID=66863 RepID=A0A419SQY5_9BACL|nr:hypothetical protein [Ammoniphilus oxalaticus]RKD26815.1 hypothetical protein BEP19_16605 [Ammoniphilus oxalaticus]
MFNREQAAKGGISSIVYDLTKWDYEVGHSGADSLDITVVKNREEIADVSFSNEDLKIHRKRLLTPMEEAELEMYIDDLIWEDEFSSFAHLATAQTEYKRVGDLIRMMKQKYEDDLLYIRHNEQESFMGYLEEVSVKKSNGLDTLFCYFTPSDEDAELIRTTILIQPNFKAVATANALKVESGGETLEISRHVQHIQ